jgi:hypothetical protein
MRKYIHTTPVSQSMIKSLIDTYDDQYNTMNEWNTLIYRSEHYKINKNNQAVSFP